jgi:hypothetical protein
MGTTVADFKEGRIERYRDRLEIETSSLYPSETWIVSKPTNPPLRYASGKLSRCVDTNNPGFHAMMRARKRHRNLRNLDIGGPLAIERSWLSLPNVGAWQNKSTTLPRGTFGVWAPTTSYKNAMLRTGQGELPSIPASLGISRADLRALGSTAIAKSLPDVPEFSLFRFVGELKAGLPKVPLAVLAKERKLRSVGDEYLNYQFGIAPTLGDLEKLYKRLQDPALRSSIRHVLGEEHRVRKTIDKDSSTTTRTLSGTEMTSIEGLTQATGSQTVTSKYRIWSSCSFVYFQANRLDRLITELDERLGGLGVFPTAIDFWNLTAWSWLVDWFVNFNHVITNLSYLGRNGLHLQRGYLMAHYEYREESRVSGLIWGTPATTVGVLHQERKYRIAASPFGFGYTWKDFSPFQLSILGALGVSRLRF